MNLKLTPNIVLLIISTYMTLCAEDQYHTSLLEYPQQNLQSISDQPIIDPSESKDVDFSFFNDPYIIEQNNEHPMEDLSNIIDDSSTQGNQAVVDPTESRDIDFTFFNDPYAFENFQNFPIKAKFGGYIQYSSWWDSRQNVSAGDGYILLFPQPKLFDVDCNDINARGEYNAGFLETRLRGEFYGPEVVGAESYAYLETDFFGSGIVINRLRIRHAFMKLTWKPSEVLLGQFWNPMFEPRCYPLTLDFAAGEPNAIFARNPQIRYTYAGNNKEFILAAAAQIDFGNTGPIGVSTTYLRNSRIPMLYARGAYDSKQVYAGIGIGFQRLVPRLQSNKGYRVHESINSAVAFLFAKVIFDALEIRQNIIFAQNANNIVLLGGFGVTCVNPTTDERKYTNINNFAYWIDFNINRKIEPGLFMGISKNLGARKDVIQCIKDPATGIEEATIYGLGLTINTLFKIAPRVRFHVLPVDFAAEIEYSRAAYGCLDNKARVQNTDPVRNVRLLLTTFYYF